MPSYDGGVTPNYDGEGMPYFGGWPGQGGYNYDEDKDGEVDGTIGDTEKSSRFGRSLEVET